MPHQVPGSRALVSYIQTGDRKARVLYRELPDQERFVYCDTVNDVYATAVAHHFGPEPTKERVDRLIKRTAERHPQYGGGVKRVLRALIEGGPRGEISPRQVLTAQHLIIREIAKRHPDFRDRADQIVAEAFQLRSQEGPPEPVQPRVRNVANDPEVQRLRDELAEQRRKYDEMRAATIDAEFTSRDKHGAVTVTLGLDGSLRDLELLRGSERMGGRSLAACITAAWVSAEKQRWRRATDLGMSVPEPGSGATRGDPFRCEAYSSTGLCRATVDRYGRLRGITFMRARLFGEDGRYGLAAEIREAVHGAHAELKATL